MTKEKALVTTDERSVEFIPMGMSDTIRLTASMVKSFIAIPTRSGALPTERDCIQFIMLCRGKRANPFEGDCYLIGYDSKDGPSFSMVCGIDLFLKRADQNEHYVGRQSGVIIQVEGGLEERHGCIVQADEKIIGGWAKVYRSDRTHPEYKTVNFAVYDTKRSRWLKDPAGQIEKVALSQALRQAFPTALGGLYTQEEMQKVTETGSGLIEKKEPVKMPTAIEPGKEAPETAPESKTDEANIDGWVCGGCGVVGTRPSPYCESCGLYQGEDPETGRYASIEKGKSGELNL